MRVLQRAVEPPSPCSYLPGRSSTLEVQVADRVSPEELDSLLATGWRHFGPFFFQPVCESCRECVSVRVPALEFTPSRSQRRVIRKATQFRRVVSRPQVDAERLALYARWHENREELRGWNSSELAEDRYRIEFGFPHPFAREAAFYDKATGALVGVGLFDEGPTSLNAIFFFYDPAYAWASLGTLNVLCLLADAKRQQKTWVYLGFRVLGCPSLQYKGNFLPHELLIDGEWQTPPSL